MVFLLSWDMESVFIHLNPNFIIKHNKRDSKLNVYRFILACNGRQGISWCSTVPMRLGRPSFLCVNYFCPISALLSPHMTRVHPVWKKPRWRRYCSDHNFNRPTVVYIYCLRCLWRQNSHVNYIWRHTNGRNYFYFPIFLLNRPLRVVQVLFFF